MIEAVQGQKVDVLEAEITERPVKGLEKVFRPSFRRHLRLHDDPVAGQPRENIAQLHLGRAVAARGLDMVDTQLERPANRGFQVFLVFARHLPGLDILPLELIAHPAAGKHRHLQFRAAKTSVLHRRRYATEQKKLKAESSNDELQFRSARDQAALEGLSKKAP